VACIALSPLAVAAVEQAGRGSACYHSVGRAGYPGSAPSVTSSGHRMSGPPVVEEVEAALGP
jgi:hypothetical protein